MVLFDELAPPEGSQDYPHFNIWLVRVRRGQSAEANRELAAGFVMAVNHKLNHVVKDRVVQNFQLNASELLISFIDGSTMKVKIVECNSPPLREGARIREISENLAKLVIECEDDSTIDVAVTDPSSSVAVRDKTYQVEYLG